MDHDLLAFSDKSFVDFEDGTYGWVDVKRFSLQGADTPDEAIMRAVIGSPRCRDHHTTRRVHRQRRNRKRFWEPEQGRSTNCLPVPLPALRPVRWIQ